MRAARRAPLRPALAAAAWWLAQCPSTRRSIEASTPQYEQKESLVQSNEPIAMLSISRGGACWRTMVHARACDDVDHGMLRAEQHATGP